MTYNTLATMQGDHSLYRRLVACAAEQGEPHPDQWVMERIWKIVVTPGWAAKWESAAAAEIEDIGANEGVITDYDILSVVQILRMPPAPEQPIAPETGEPVQPLPEAPAQLPEAVAAPVSAAIPTAIPTAKPAKATRGGN